MNSTNAKLGQQQSGFEFKAIQCSCLVGIPKMLWLFIVLSLATFVDGGCFLKKLCNLVSGTSNLQLQKTTLYQFERNTPQFCLAIRQLNTYECYAESNIDISISRFLSGSYAMDVINTSDGSVHEVELFVAHEADQYRIISHVNIEYPAFGSILTKKLDIGISRTDDTPISSMHVSIIGVTEIDMSPHTLQIESQQADAEPGSIFYSITPRLTYMEKISGDVHTLDGSSAHGYLELVLSDEEIKSNRRYANYQLNTPAGSNEDDNVLPAAQQQARTVIAPPINICVFSGDKWDGQKQIWVQQSQFMDRSKYHFTWLVHLEPNEVHNPRTSLNPVVRGISHLSHISIAQNPNFQLNLSQLEEIPGDGSMPASATWENDHRKLYRYAHERLLAANYSIQHITPPWCQQFYINMQHTLQSQDCDIVVYGNQGGGSADIVIIDTAAVLNIPTVGELQNLNVALDQVPTVLVAPSWYAAEHESVQRSVRAYKHQHSLHDMHGKLRTNGIESVVVIPPSVDAAVFDPARFHSSSPSGYVSGGPRVYRHPACEVTGNTPSNQANFPCVVIAFVARLSTEKNPGLFLQAAYEILQVYPFARFTIVGDGALRQSLENLADRLQIAWAVHFTGWVSATALPSLLAGVDIVINPSLRAWSETFCIANIEAMSMEVPLVTFAVGGIGEYVQDPALSCADRNSSDSRGGNGGEGGPSTPHGESQKDFSVSDNAIVVDRATPVALASATLHLIRRPALRSALGRRGRQTILDHFTVQRQMEQYELLYTKLGTG